MRVESGEEGQDWRRQDQSGRPVTAMWVMVRRLDCILRAMASDIKKMALAAMQGVNCKEKGRKQGLQGGALCIIQA